MTQNDYIFIVQTLFQEGEIELRVHPGIINQALNESLQKLWPVAVAADEDFWTRSSTFGSRTSVANPANFSRLRCVEIPNAAQGVAIALNHRQWQTVQNNDVIVATADYPNYRQDAGVIFLAPAVAGTLYYVANVSEITTWTVDLTAFGGAPAVLPWPLEEPYIMGALYILAQRELGKPGVPESDVKKLFAISDAAKAVFDKSKDMYALFHQSTVAPVLPPKQEPQQ